MHRKASSHQRHTREKSRGRLPNWNDAPDGRCPKSDPCRFPATNESEHAKLPCSRPEPNGNGNKQCCPPAAATAAATTATVSGDASATGATTTAHPTTSRKWHPPTR